MTRPSRGRALRAAAGAVVVAVIAAIVVVATSGSGTPPVTAIFADASPLQNGNLVKSSGAVIGQVASIKLVNGKAQVGLSLSKSNFVLHSDARATIDPVSLLGERYVDVNPGSASKPLMGRPAVISADHTGSGINLDQVVNTLDDPSSAGLASLVGALGTGISGQGTNVNRAVSALAPTMLQAGQLTRILDQQTGVLDQLIHTAAPNAQAVGAGQGDVLRQLVQKAEGTLSTVADQRPAIDATLSELPATLINAQQALANLAGVAETTTPVLQSLKPVTDNLTPITSELNAFTAAANPALAHLPAVLDKVNSLLDQARPVVASLGPGATSLQAVTQSLLPLGNAVLDHPPGVNSSLDDAMTGVAEWAMSTNSYDGLGHFFRAAVVVSNTPGQTLGDPLAGTLLAGVGSIPTPVPPSAKQRGVGDTPTPAPPPPGVAPAAAPPGSLAALLPNVGNLLNASGLTRPQEQGLLGELLGGL